MITIEVNGQFLFLERSATIRFEKNFTVLFQDLYQGDFSFPFTLDAEANYKILGFLNKPEATNKVTSYSVNIFFWGLPFSPATLLITKTTRKKFQTNLVAGIKSLKTVGKTLPEINFGDSTYLGLFQDEIAAKATVISKDVDYTHFGFTFVPHINEGFYGSGGNPDFLKVLNMVNPNTGDIYYNTPGTGNKYALVPWFYLHFMLKKIFDEEGLTPIGTFWDHPEMKKLLVYNNRSLDSLNEIGETKIVVVATQTFNMSNFTDYSVSSTPVLAREKVMLLKGPSGTIDEPQMFDNALAQYEISQVGLYTFEVAATAQMLNIPDMALGIFVNNKWIGGAEPITVDSAGWYPSIFSVSYTATMADIGKKAYLGFYWRYLPYIGDSLLTTTYPFCRIHAGSTLTIKQSNNTNLNLYSRYVVPSNHMKSINVEEFLLAIKQLGVEFTFDYTSGTVSLDFVTDKINSTEVEDWTAKAVEDFELELDKYNKGYTVGYNFGEIDQLNIDNFKKIDLSNNIEDFMTFSDLPTIDRAGHTAFVKNLNQYFISVYDQYASPQYFWRKHTDYYYTTKYAGGETEVKLNFAPMLMGMGLNVATSTSVATQTALMPAANSSGSSEMFGIGDNDFDLRFCFLRGQNILSGTPNNKGGNYMFASTTKYGLNGHTIGDYDFTLHLDSGFFKRYINPIYDLIANGQIMNQDFRLTELDILTISKKLRISVDGVVYLLKTVSIIAGDNLTLSRAKMLKL